MSETGYSYTVDLESIKRKLLKSSGAIKKQQMLFKPTQGETVVRIIPYKHGADPFNVMFFHYDLANRSALCASTFAKPCPICEFAENLRKSNKDEKTFEAFKKIASKQRVYIPIIVRNKEDEGAKFWGVGKNVYEALLSLYVNPDYGDISHPTEGTDITIKFVGPNPQTKILYGKTEVLPKRNRSVLLNDKTQMMNLIKSVPNISELFPEQSYDELQKILDDYLNPKENQESSDKTISSSKNDDLGTVLNSDDNSEVVTNLDKEFEELFKK